MKAIASTAPSHHKPKSGLEPKPDKTPFAALAEIEQSPWRWSFLQSCRWLEAQFYKSPRLGEELHPHNEWVRLGQSPSTAFAPREIDTAHIERGKLVLRLLGLGLYGPNGPLPLHLTEEAHERRLQDRDTTLTDFLDMFHHRWLSLFYRAWAQGQSAAGLDRPDDERFSTYIASLAGLSSSDTDQIPPHALYAASGHFVRHARNPAGLVATLERYFAVPIVIEEYAMQWLRLEHEDKTRLGYAHTPSTLGNAVLGHCVPDRQFSFVLHIGPLSLHEYEQFLPKGPWLDQLIAWVRRFVGLEFHWRVRLLLGPGQAPRSRLGTGACLGRTAWLSPKHDDSSLAGLIFSPGTHSRTIL